MASHQKKPRGLTFIEIAVFVSMVGFVIATAIVFNPAFGWLGSALLGTLIFCSSALGLVLIVDYGIKGVPRIPGCKNGCCRGLFDYDVREFGGEFVQVSRCGGRYRRNGRRFVIVNDDRTETPYLIWRPFRGWFPDAQGRHH
jgi:hypothetical protein